MKEKKIDWWETGFLIIYGIILLHDFWDTTMFPAIWPSRIGYLFFAAVILYTLAKLIWKKGYTKKEGIAALAVLAAFCIPALTTEYSFLLEIGFLIVGAKDVKLDKILKVYLVIGTVVLLAAFAASQMGWIENLLYVRQPSGRLRNSFGIIYPTDFAAHIFYLMLAGTCIDNRRITVSDLFLVLVLAVFVWMECEAKTGFVCLGMYTVLLLVIKLCSIAGERMSKKEPGRWAYLLCAVPLLCCIFFWWMTAHFKEEDAFWEKWDSLFSGRLWLSAKGIREYGFSLFGQTIPEVGNGRSIEVRPDYFFLDDAYIRIALEYGIVMLFVVLLLLAFLIWKGIKLGRIVIAAAVIMIAVHSIMEHHLLEIAYNPFLFGLFADWSKSARPVTDGCGK